MFGDRGNDLDEQDGQHVVDVEQQDELAEQLAIIGPACWSVQDQAGDGKPMAANPGE